MTAAQLLYLLSPAKTLDMTLSAAKPCSTPQLLNEAHILVKQLQELSQAKVKSLLGVSDALAKLNYERFQNFAIVADEKKEADLVPDETHKQAVLSFNGPAYQGLAAQELSDKELKYAQDHLRILCGLYVYLAATGILRPLDLIQAYRLEMGQKFANSRGKDLYTFWDTTLSEQINAYFRENEMKKEQKVIVNVASQEYFKSIPLDALDDDIQVIDCVFQDDGKIKSVYAKRARGLMCRYLIQNQVNSIEGIKKFDLEGYIFTTTASNDTTFVFNRTAAKQKQVLQEIQAKARLKKEQQSLKAPSVKEEPKKKNAKDDTVPEAEDSAETKQPTIVSTRKRRKTG